MKFVLLTIFIYISFNFNSILAGDSCDTYRHPIYGNYINFF